MTSPYQILLYYKYTDVNDPQALMHSQKDLCTKLGMKGRIIVAYEGINGTIEGTHSACKEYMETMKADPRFADIHWKISSGTSDGSAFPRLSVKVRKEIVSLHLTDDSEDINPNEMTGTHLTPEELRMWYEEGKEFHIVDMRNDYELRSGKFEGTIFPELNNFRDLKKNLSKIAHLKDKPVLTVCTGGVRCEKASGLLVREGFENVYQLDGGIVSYMEKYPGKDFKGSLYVFDKRVTMHFEDPDTHEIIGRCQKCDTPSEHYVNCENLMCHDHFICCENCLEGNGSAFCNIRCKLSWRWYQFKKSIALHFAHK